MQITLAMFLVLVLANLTWLWFNLIWFWELKNRHKQLSQVEDKQLELTQQYHQALQAYHAQAEELLQELHHQAGLELDDYRAHLQKLFSELQSNFQNNLQKLAHTGEDRLMSLWDKSLSEITRKHQQILQHELANIDKLYQNTEKVLQASLEKYLTVVTQQTVASQHKAVEQINLDLAQMQQEIQAYQKQRQLEIDQLVRERVEQLSRQLFAQSLSKKQHQQIVHKLTDYLTQTSDHE